MALLLSRRGRGGCKGLATTNAGYAVSLFAPDSARRPDPRKLPAGSGSCTTLRTDDRWLPRYWTTQCGRLLPWLQAKNICQPRTTVNVRRAARPDKSAPANRRRCRRALRLTPGWTRVAWFLKPVASTAHGRDPGVLAPERASCVGSGRRHPPRSSRGRSLDPRCWRGSAAGSGPGRRGA